jgi:Asp-tRNA(Asn)/Glu-tRNA(Gln) amidotransferase A subunit family amidase
MQAAMKAGRVTSRELVLQYLTRIALYEDKLHAAITVNPNALKEAEALDRERAGGKVRGPLHGIPIALKDNIQTTNMPTTGGALAFDRFTPPYEATLTTNLRRAGAVIIAKTSMTDLANWVAGPPTPMPGNYSALGGYGMNPYDPRRDPREATFDGRPALVAGGSSSGVGTAANFWAANVGTETSGSILNPANQNMLVGIKPTVGSYPHHGGSGYAGSTGQKRDRYGDSARSDGRQRAGSKRSGDEQVQISSATRLQALSPAERLEGSAHWYSASLLLRRSDTARCRSGEHGSEFQSNGCDGGGD